MLTTVLHCLFQMATKPKVKVLDISGSRAADVDVPKKKKKKVLLPAKVTKEQALALVAPKRVSKLNTKGMRSILGDSAEDIQQMLEANNNDSAVSLMQKRMLQTVVDLIPYAEHAVRKSKGARGVYQINSLITSLRELMIDMQSTRDKGAIGDTLIERIIRPLFLDIGMFLVTENEKVLKDVKEELGADAYKLVKAIHQRSLERTAQSIQAKYAEAKQGTIAFLQQ